MTFHLSRFLLPLGFLLLLFATSCQTMYVPNQAQVPLMSEGDETQVCLTAATNGYGGQIAYSPYYHWAVILNGSTFNVVQDTNFDVKYRSSFGEIGTGYYTRLNKYARMEVLFGLGTGSIGFNDERDRYRRAFVQPSFGVSGPWVDAGISTRFTYVDYFQRKEAGTATLLDQQGIFMEPILTARAGYEQVKFQGQFGFTIPLGTPDITYRHTFFGLGIHITFVKDYEKYNH
jgi:hypothetical protein